MPELSWENLGFSYLPTRSNIRYNWQDGAWDEGELTAEATIPIPIAATCLHYGQSCFEGLKAFATEKGEIRIFRPAENAKRMADTAWFLCAPEVPENLFLDAVRRVVRDNIDYVPPYGSGGSLYIRPLLIGSAPTIGIRPSDEYKFIVLLSPVGPYYKGGLTPVEALIIEDFDRSAPMGTGRFKVAGNYVASLRPSAIARERGFPITLYLDSASHRYIDEFSTSNFIAVSHDGRYITPDSGSILPSITNRSLQELARDLGIEVECRPVEVGELAEFKEVGACGTAVVITPVSRIVHGDREYRFDPPGEDSILMRLYREMTRIQFGEIPDRHGWMMPV